MARPKPDPQTRALRIIEAASTVFATKGFRQAQMADIAAQMNVSAGTLYNSVVSKDALFEAVILHHFTAGPDLAALLQSNETGQLVAQLRTAVDDQQLYPKMAAALDVTRPRDSAPEAFASELEALVSEHYDFVAANSQGIRILEQSAIDFPALATSYFGYLRSQVIDQWETYIERRRAAGFMGAVIDDKVAARSVIEIIAWWSLHAEGDPGSEQYKNAAVRESVIAFAIRGLG